MSVAQSALAKVNISSRSNFTFDRTTEQAANMTAVIAQAVASRSKNPE